jgi:hypothetical protein
VIPVERDIEDADRLENLREICPFSGIVTHVLMETADDLY